MTRKLSLFLILLLLVSATAFSQSAKEYYETAYREYENGQFAKALENLTSAADSNGATNPRIESLKALCYFAQKDYFKTKVALDKYFRLVPENAKESEQHQAMITLNKNVEKILEQTDKNFKEQRQTERDQAAETSISDFGTTVPKNDNDPLAELEMWNKVKVSNNAGDYYLFIKRFPAGSFAKMASAKMNEIGDPVWNEVRKSKDPFVYRDFIAKNSNSPFILEAKDKMNMLAASAIAWEQIKNSKNPETFKSYIEKYPEGANVNEAKRLTETLALKQNSLILLDYHRTVLFKGPKFAVAKIEITDDGIKYTEFKTSADGYEPPNPEHNFTITCNQLSEVKYKDSIFKFKFNKSVTNTFGNKSNIEFYVQGYQGNIDSAPAMADAINTFCKLK